MCIASSWSACELVLVPFDGSLGDEKERRNDARKTRRGERVNKRGKFLSLFSH